ncbi:hypothetical protein G6F53_013803 [Rhizopus delemar]|nr:hypothetical protein G6F53_013803 [Rhizopus delemar]
MPKKISNDKREAVKSGIRSGRTTMDISRTTGVSKWTINRIRKEEKNIKARNRGGRPVVVKKITNAIIRLKLRQGLLRTDSDAQLFLRSLGYSISKRSLYKPEKAIEVVSRQNIMDCGGLEVCDLQR